MSMATRSNAARRKKTRLYVSIIAKHYTSSLSVSSGNAAHDEYCAMQNAIWRPFRR